MNADIAWTIAALPIGWFLGIAILYLIDVALHGWKNDR